MTPALPCSPYVFRKGRMIAASSTQRVHPIRTEYTVDGDHSTYKVVIEPGKTPSCTCPTSKARVCSHVVAVAAHRHLHQGSSR